MLPRGLLKEYSKPLAWGLCLMDVMAIWLAGYFAYRYRFGFWALTPHYFNALGIAAAVTSLVFSFFKIYDSIRGKQFWQHISHLIQAVLSVFIIMACIAFITKSGAYFSREWFLYWSLLSLMFILVLRVSLVLFLRLMRKNKWNERRVIIIGAGELGEKLALTLQQALWTGFRIINIFDDQPCKKQIAGIDVLLTPADLDHYLLMQSQPIDEIWLALPLSEERRVKQILHALRHHTVAIRFVLDIFGLGLLNQAVTDLAGFPALNLNASPMIGFNRIIKAIEDKIFASAILIIISPLFLFIMLLVKFSSKGPIFFKQRRHGCDGRIIKIYKFRTMKAHVEAPGQVTQAHLNDERCTKVGKVLRKLSLDELPQFINVLQGRMSIVGPRPHAVSHNEFYKETIKAYMQRHKVKPGITGWAQINGWRGETDTLNKMEKRVEYDLYYIDHWSLMFDLKIILITIFKGFINKNAY